MGSFTRRNNPITNNQFYKSFLPPTAVRNDDEDMVIEKSNLYDKPTIPQINLLDPVFIDRLNKQPKTSR